MTTDTCDTGAVAGAGAVPGTNTNGEGHQDVPLLTDGVEKSAATATSADQNPTDSKVSFDGLEKFGENKHAIKEPFRTGQSLATSGVGFDDIINQQWFCNFLNNHPDAAGTLLFGMGLDCSELLGTAWFQNLRTSSDPAAFGRFCQGFLRPKPVPASTNYSNSSSSSSIGDEVSGNDKPTTTSNTRSLTGGTSSADTTVKVNNNVKAKLPAATLASVLDFMEYGDVRHILCTGKYVAVDAAKHIKTINITRECQLFTGPMTKSVTRRFANVKHVNCLCLVRIDADGDQILSIEAATRIVPFLITFPNLSSAFVGGTSPGGRFEYDAVRCVTPYHHEDSFQVLTENFRGSIRSGALPYRLNLQGVPGLAYDDCTAPLPVLPADAMGSVFDFVTYHDIQAAVRSSTSMFEDAIGHVRVLTIMHPSELSLSRTTSLLIHRFRSVKEVNCFCFFEDDDGNNYTPSNETVSQIVPFLVTFPKLSAAFLGRWDGESRHDYTFYEYYSWTGDQAAIRGLVEQFCGAFESGALPSNLDLKGVLACSGDNDGYYGLGKVYCAGGGGCRACSRICSSFPFNVVVRLAEHRSTCIPDAVRISALRDRPGSTEHFRSEAAIDGLLLTLGGYVHAITIHKTSEVPRDQNFVQRMTGRGRTADCHGNFVVRYLSGPAKESLRAVVASGFELTLASAPSAKLMDSASAYYFSRETWRNDGGSTRMKAIWVRSSLNFLISLGFDLNPDDFFLVDPFDEPALLQRMVEEEE